MPETTGIWGMLDQLGDAAGKLAEIYEMLVKAGLIKGELPPVPPPYIPEEKPFWKTVYFPITLGAVAVGGAGVYYAVKKRK